MSSLLSLTKETNQKHHNNVHYKGTEDEQEIDLNKDTSSDNEGEEVITEKGLPNLVPKEARYDDSPRFQQQQHLQQQQQQQQEQNLNSRSQDNPSEVASTRPQNLSSFVHTIYNNYNNNNNSIKSENVPNMRHILFSPEKQQPQPLEPSNTSHSTNVHFGNQNLQHSSQEPHFHQQALSKINSTEASPHRAIANSFSANQQPNITTPPISQQSSFQPSQTHWFNHHKLPPPSTLLSNSPNNTSNAKPNIQNSSLQAQSQVHYPESTSLLSFSLQSQQQEPLQNQEHLQQQPSQQSQQSQHSQQHHQVNFNNSISEDYQHRQQPQQSQLSWHYSNLDNSNKNQQIQSPPSNVHPFIPSSSHHVAQQHHTSQPQQPQQPQQQQQQQQQPSQNQQYHQHHFHHHHHQQQQQYHQPQQQQHQQQHSTPTTHHSQQEQWYQGKFPIPGNSLSQMMNSGSNPSNHVSPTSAGEDSNGDANSLGSSENSLSYSSSGTVVSGVTNGGIRKNIPKPYSNGRKRVSKACLECQQRHVRCGFDRPCERCKRLGLNCVDVTSNKKRGRKSMNSAMAAAASAAAITSTTANHPKMNSHQMAPQSQTPSTANMQHISVTYPSLIPHDLQSSSNIVLHNNSYNSFVQQQQQQRQK